MQRREKILLLVLLLLIVIFFGQKIFTSIEIKKNDNLKEYSTQDLQLIASSQKTPKSNPIDLGKESYKKDFFYRNKQKIYNPPPNPKLEEIVKGPSGYAAIISGNFVVIGDKVMTYTVTAIDDERVILKLNGRSKILERK